MIKRRPYGHETYGRYRPAGKLARCRCCTRMFRAIGTWADKAGCCSANCRALLEREPDAE